MRTKIVILLTLLAAIACFGQAGNFFKDPAKLGSLNKASAAAGCSTSDTSRPHDEMLYGWGAGDSP